MSWLRTVSKGLNRVEHGIDRVRFKFMETFGVRKPLMIHPYIGYGNSDTFYLRGRVLLDNKVRGATKNDSTWANFKNTFRRFESDEIPYATVQATAAGATVTAQCNEEGFYTLVLKPEGAVSLGQYWHEVQLEVIETPIDTLDISNTLTTGQVVIPPADARFGVISDLDDTIMQTDVLNLFKMLYNTVFQNAHTRLPFDGVAAFYRALHTGTNGVTNPIYYVSSSPWNLYDFITEFFTLNEIPLGPVFLRDIGLAAHAIGAESHMGHKLAHIQRILDRNPDLPFILIGDSGQKDVWVYHEVVLQNPGRIPAVYIRDVTITDHDRRRKIEAIAGKVEVSGCEMLLVSNTCEAAEHAANRGFIDPDTLPAIRRACDPHK